MIEILTITKEQLAEHAKWAENHKAGQRLEMSSANLRGATLSFATLSGATLSGANLSEANLRRANLSGANLREANLSGANLSGANLREANLRRANLYGANLYGANLRGADLSRADLSGANLYGADLGRAILYGANLHGAIGIITIGPIGSRRAILYATAGIGKTPLRVFAGCRRGVTLTEFAKVVRETHGDNLYAQEYKAAIHFLRAWGKMHREIKHE